MKRLFIALWLLFAGLPADATEWAMDAESSHLQFVVTYTGQETPGVFRRFDTRLDFDPANPATGRLTSTMQSRPLTGSTSPLFRKRVSRAAAFPSPTRTATRRSATCNLRESKGKSSCRSDG